MLAEKLRSQQDEATDGGVALAERCRQAVLSVKHDVEVSRRLVAQYVIRHNG